MLSALGTSLIATKGASAPEVEQTYTRARQLCQSLDDPYQLFSVLRGLHYYYNNLAELQTAQELGEQLLTLAQQMRDAAMLIAAHRALGSTLFWLGAAADSYTLVAQGIALYDLQQHRAPTFLFVEDAGVICHSLDAWTLWYLGYPDQGLTRSQEAVTLAQLVAHPFSLDFALGCAAIVHQFRREVSAVQEYAESAISLATEQGFPHWRARGAVLRGWALVQQGQVKEGIEQITQGLRAIRATGAEINWSYFLALLAEAHGTLGEPEAGLTALAQALTHVDNTGERWYEPELYRLKGALLLQQNSNNEDEAEACFHQAISIARSQQAKSLELRATTSLARLCQQQGKRQEAYDLLAPVEFIPIMVYWASHERRHHVWPVFGSPMCSHVLRSSWISRA
jgi:predicted ATPase